MFRVWIDHDLWSSCYLVDSLVASIVGACTLLFLLCVCVYMFQGSMGCWFQRYHRERVVGNGCVVAMSEPFFIVAVETTRAVPYSMMVATPLVLRS